jgi:hypothetical protein
MESILKHASVLIEESDGGEIWLTAGRTLDFPLNALVLDANLTSAVFVCRNVQSLRERQGIFTMLAQMPRLIQIDIDQAADDAILWQIAVTCPQLRSAHQP